jgi:hypothetical protein
MSLDDFDAWFAVHRDRATRVAGYEHAMFMRWTAARLLKAVAS